MPKPRDAAACGRFTEAGASLKIVAMVLACARQMSDPGQERGIAGKWRSYHSPSISIGALIPQSIATPDATVVPVISNNMVASISMGISTPPFPDGNETIPHPNIPLRNTKHSFAELTTHPLPMGPSGKSSHRPIKRPSPHSELSPELEQDAHDRREEQGCSNPAQDVDHYPSHPQFMCHNVPFNQS